MKNPVYQCTLHKSNVNIGGKLLPENRDSTQLHELSLVNSKFLGAIPYDIRLDMKLDYTISRSFQEMSLETLHHLYEQERTQAKQSSAIAVFKILYAGYLLSANHSNKIDYRGQCF